MSSIWILKKLERAVEAGYRDLRAFNQEDARRITGSPDLVRRRTTSLASWSSGRPYHMDPGIGHEIESELQAHGYPIVWLQYLPAR